MRWGVKSTSYGLVDSVGGIIDQASTGNVTPQRTELLQKEASQLVEAIKIQAQVSTDKGVKPLAGDPIKLQVEAALGKALEILLPSDAKNAFGIGVVTFSPKDAILQTRKSVDAAREQVDSLRKALADSKDLVKDTVSTLDVALQNAEASKVTIRDVDQALKVANLAGRTISTNPQSALDSFGALSQSALGLLK